MRRVILKPNVVMSTLVKINLSADQWQLYTNSFPRYVIERVASALNTRFNDLFNRGASREEVYRGMAALMDSFAKYGAADTEPHTVLGDLIDEMVPSYNK